MHFFDIAELAGITVPPTPDKLPSNTVPPELEHIAVYDDASPEGALRALIQTDKDTVVEACIALGWNVAQTAVIKTIINRVARAVQLQNLEFTEAVMHEVGVGISFFDELIKSKLVASVVREITSAKESTTDESRARGLALAMLPEAIMEMADVVRNGSAPDKVRAFNALVEVSGIAKQGDAFAGGAGVTIILQQSRSRPGALPPPLEIEYGG